LINNLLYEKSKQSNQLNQLRKNQTALQINLNLKMKEIKESRVRIIFIFTIKQHIINLQSAKIDTNFKLKNLAAENVKYK